MPLDQEPVPDGNVVVVDGVACVLKSEREALLVGEEPRYVSHFATCPQAAAHRRPRAEKRGGGPQRPARVGDGGGQTTGVLGEVAPGPGLPRPPGGKRPAG
jgi:hypothetical protein